MKGTLFILGLIAVTMATLISGENAAMVDEAASAAESAGKNQSARNVQDGNAIPLAREDGISTDWLEFLLYLEYAVESSPYSMRELLLSHPNAADAGGEAALHSSTVLDDQPRGGVDGVALAVQARNGAGDAGHREVDFRYRRVGRRGDNWEVDWDALVDVSILIRRLHAVGDDIGTGKHYMIVRITKINSSLRVDVLPDGRCIVQEPALARGERRRFDSIEQLRDRHPDVGLLVGVLREDIALDVYRKTEGISPALIKLTEVPMPPVSSRLTDIHFRELQRRMEVSKPENFEEAERELDHYR